MTGVILRAGVPFAEVMAALHRRAFARPWPAADFASLGAMPGVGGWIAVLPGGAGAPPTIPAGFILCRAAADEAEILTLAVLPQFRRRGVARTLVGTSASELAAGGASRLFLEVAAGNDGALGLYAALGFSEVGRRPDYYDPGVAETRDALTLRATLPLAAGPSTGPLLSAK